jgi:CDGSH-type Zn-finger protein
VVKSSYLKGKDIAAVDSTEITVFVNGPLKLNGKFVIKDAEGREFDLGGRDAIALCRCGHSGNKPFCDGSHREKGFESRVEARPLPPKG